MIGKITKKAVSSDPNNQPPKWTRTALQINGKTFSTFDADMTFNEGDDVKVTYTVSSDGKYNNITNIEANKANEFEQPEVVKPGVQTGTENFYETQNKTQRSIVAQSSIKAGLEIIKLHNDISEAKIEPTMKNVLVHAQIARTVYDELVK